MKTSSKKESLCAGVLGGKGRTERRLADALDAVSEFRDYRKLLLEIQQMSPEARTSCPGLAAAVTERAFDAEVAGRALIKHALDSVNELRDEGIFYDAFGKVARELSGDGAKSFFEKLRKEADPAKERFGDVAADLLNEAAGAAEALGLEFSSQRDSLLVRRKNGPQGEDQLRLATTRQLGQAGRVSSAEFFGGRNGRAFVTSPILYTPIDCHHRPIRIHRDHINVDVDMYAATIGGLGATKDLLYQQARRVAELGPRGLRGEDPVTALVVAIAVIGAALVIYGIATNDVGLVVFGAILIAGSAFVAFGGYTLIIGVVV
jgi:hypothetical protein